MRPSTALPRLPEFAAGSLCAVALLVALGCGAGPRGAAEMELRVLRQGRDVVVADRERLAGALVALLASCSVDSTAQVATFAARQEILGSGSFVRVAFAVPRLARLATGEERSVDEILLPLPEGSWPAHLLVRSGNQLLALTKYDPLLLRALVEERALELAGVAPYRFLVDPRSAP